MLSGRQNWSYTHAMNKILPLVITVLVTTAMLSGCASVPSSPVSAATEGEAGEAPDSTPAPDGKPAAGALVIGPDGLEGLAIGSAVPEVGDDESMVVFDDAACEPNPEGRWVANYDPVGDKPMFWLEVADETVTRIDAGPSLRTATGVTIGAPLSELLSRYPDGFDSTIEGNEFGDVYVINGTTGQLEITVVTDPAWEPALVDTVFAIRSFELGHAPTIALVGGNVAGNCG